jgi:glycosyltransferase involved in cell wall biosynthesis
MTFARQSKEWIDHVSDELRLVVTIPALNEERTIAEVIAGVPKEMPGVGDVQVVVVDDGSDDRTAELAVAAGADLIRHPRPRGVGSAFHSGLAYAIDRGADLVVSIDGDGQFDSADIQTLIAPVVSGDADFATASRFVDSALTPEMSRLRLWGNRMMSRFISRLAGQRFYDVSCGMRCYSRHAALHLNPLASFTYTQEVVLNLAFKRMRIVEVPIRVRGEREFGRSRVARSLWAYGLRSSLIILRCYRDYYPLRFFGGIAVGLLVPAAGLSIFLLLHYLQNGQLTPHKWAGFLSAGFLGLTVLMLLIGLIGDMLNRQRIYLEELLYHQRGKARGDFGERTSRPG